MALLNRVSNLFRRAKLAQEIDDELQSHIEMRMSDNLASGMPLDQARRDGVASFRKPHADQRASCGFGCRAHTGIFLDGFTIRFSPTGKSAWIFHHCDSDTCSCIGATTAIFSCAYALLLRSLPFQQADRIVTINETHPQVAGGGEVTFPDYKDWRSQESSFDQIAGYSIASPETVSLVWDGTPSRSIGFSHPAISFSLLGITPSLGRTFVEQDDTPRANHVAVISPEAWERYFGADKNIIGRTVDLNDVSLHHYRGASRWKCLSGDRRFLDASFADG